MSLLDQLPIYVTRPDGDGDIGTWSISAWVPLVSVALVFLNVIVWGLIGLAVAGSLVVGVVL